MDLFWILQLANSGLLTFLLPLPFGFSFADAIRHGRNLVVAGAPVFVSFIYTVPTCYSIYFCRFVLYACLIKIQLAGSLEIKRNSTGHIVDLSGVSALMLEWLTQRYKFKFVYDYGRPVVIGLLFSIISFDI